MTQYGYDEEWLEKVYHLICPYCEYPMVKPHLGKRKCLRCDFELYGPPKTVAFIIIEPEVEFPKEDHCPECKSPDLFYEAEEKETVCLSCGLVVQGSQHYTGYEKIEYPFGHHYDFSKVRLRENEHYWKKLKENPKSF